MQRKSILIRDSHKIMVSAIESILKLTFDNPDVTIHNDDETLGTLLLKKHFDLIVTDFQSNSGDPFDFVQELVRLSKHSNILVLGSRPSNKMSQQFIDIGVKGYLEKLSVLSEFKEAFNKVEAGQTYFKVSNN
jgi:DNA-binding NarL/FixJ family response regulator